MLQKAIFAIVVATLPLFLSLLRAYPHRRPWALMAIGVLLFTGDLLRSTGYVVGSPLWNGTSKGIGLSPIDTIALALILTRPTHRTPLPFLGPIAFFAAPIWLSLVASSIPMMTAFMCWQVLRLALLFVAIGGELHDRRMRDALLTGLSLGLIVQAGFVLQQKASGVVQATGSMDHQNLLGMMTEISLLPLIAAVLAGYRSKTALAGIAAGFVVIAGGGSRAAVAMAGAGVLLLGLLSLIRGVTPVKLKALGFGALALTVVAPLAFLNLMARFESASFTKEDHTRPALERAARAIAADYPLGVGANLFVTTSNTKGYAERAGVPWNEHERRMPVHNAFLLARAETGWLGEIALILLLLWPMARGFRFVFADRKSSAGEVALGSTVALLVLAVHSQVEFVLYTYGPGALLMVNLAIIAAAIRASQQVRGRGTPSRPSVRAQPALAGGAAR